MENPPPYDQIVPPSDAEAFEIRCRVVSAWLDAVSAQNEFDDAFKRNDLSSAQNHLGLANRVHLYLAIGHVNIDLFVLACEREAPLDTDLLCSMLSNEHISMEYVRLLLKHCYSFVVWNAFESLPEMGHDRLRLFQKYVFDHYFKKDIDFLERLMDSGKIPWGIASCYHLWVAHKIKSLRHLRIAFEAGAKVSLEHVKEVFSEPSEECLSELPEGTQGEYLSVWIANLSDADFKSFYKWVKGSENGKKTYEYVQKYLDY